MKERGRPVRGAIAGLFFGLFISLDLVVLGVMPLEADALAFIPILGAVGGVVLGLTAPLRRREGGQKAVAIPKPGASAA